LTFTFKRIFDLKRSFNQERFHLLDDRFNFADVDMLTANVDPLVIAVLRKHQVVKTTWVTWRGKISRLMQTEDE